MSDVKPFFNNHIDFFEQYLSKVWWRATEGAGGYSWCREWWKHAEAYARVQMLWRSWEAARVRDELEGPANWMVHVCDPMMRELLNPQGTFKNCVDGHRARTEDDDHLPYLTPARPADAA